MSWNILYFVSPINHPYSQVADTLVTLGSAMHPGVAKSIGVPRVDQSATGLNTMGSTGASLFVCSNYIASQHIDKDIGLSVTFQLDKVADPDEFDFAYTEWGFYIEPIPNTVW